MIADGKVFVPLTNNEDYLLFIGDAKDIMQLTNFQLHELIEAILQERREVEKKEEPES